MARGAKPKVYEPEIVFKVQALYDSGYTQDEIAAHIGFTQKVIWNIMRRHAIARRRQIKRDQMGPRNHMWKGDEAGYQALHIRLDKRFGKPRHCDECGTADESRTYDWANLTGNYTDITDFRRMCRQCHRRYDNARRGVAPP